MVAIKISPVKGPWNVGAVWTGILLSILCVVCSEDQKWANIALGSKLSPMSNETWVSPQGTFAMGFYPAFDQAETYSVGIWFNSISVQTKTVIWTAGEELKVSPNASLELTLDGDLVLCDYPHEVSAWRSNTSHRGAVGATLRDNGNFVVSDSAHRIVWESFDTPSDTLVPGQRLHVGQMLRAASRNSVSSYYNLAMESSGELILKWESNVNYWASGTGSLPLHSRPRGAIFAGNGVFALFDARGRLIWSKYSNDYTDTKVVLRYLRLDVDGNLRMYSWIEESQTWISGWQAVENQCDVFATCGVYGVCSFNSTGPVCKCSFQSEDYIETDLPVPSKGCRRPMPLGGCKGRATMLGLKRTVLYSLYPPHDVYNNTSSDKCKEACLRDDLCVAVTVMNDGSGVCRLKRTNFISGYTYGSVPAVSFLKTCLVPEAVSNPHEVVDRPTSVNAVSSPSSSNSSKGSSRVCRLCLTGASLGTLGAFLIIEIVVGLYLWSNRNKRKTLHNGKHALLNQSSGAVIRLSYAEVQEVTKNFEQRLGPSIFRCVLPDKKPLVIKQLNVEVGEKQFRMTLSILGSIHHRNLACLQGFCCECKHRLLIYEHINNGSLDQWLFGGNVKQAKRLNWQRRLDIATGVARAISYLHSECRECICHGTLKLENVLLDDDFTAKVTDFGLAKLRISSKSEKDTSSEPTPEQDVFSYGLMLLEIISGKKDPPCPEEGSLSMWAFRAYERGQVDSILDTRIEGNVEWNEVERALKIALWCMQQQPFIRPSMNEVVKVLDGTLLVDPPPPPITCQPQCTKDLSLQPERDAQKYLELATTSHG